MTVVWMGKGGQEFERYIDQFTGHVSQQQHMGYLLNEKVAILWIKHGSPEVVIRIGMAQRVHTSCHFITPAQFATDVMWLHGALLQSIQGHHGKSLIRKYEHTQDGILAWKCLIDTYCYDGDVDIYLLKQQEVLSCKFNIKYPSGMLKFLEDYESAFMNIEYVIQRQYPDSNKEGGALHTDHGK